MPPTIKPQTTHNVHRAVDDELSLDFGKKKVSMGWVYVEQSLCGVGHRADMQGGTRLFARAEEEVEGARSSSG